MSHMLKSRSLRSMRVVIERDTKQRNITQCLSLSLNEYGKREREREIPMVVELNQLQFMREKKGKCAIAIYEKKRGKCAIFLPNCRDLFLAHQKGKKTFKRGSLSSTAQSCCCSHSTDV